MRRVSDGTLLSNALLAIVIFVKMNFCFFFTVLSRLDYGLSNETGLYLLLFSFNHINVFDLNKVLFCVHRMLLLNI